MLYTIFTMFMLKMAKNKVLMKYVCYMQYINARE